MKLAVKAVLQHLLGLEVYLFLFSLIKIFTLKWDRVEGDFNYLLQLIDDTGIVIDAGANIGIMTVLLARKVKKGFVYSFEPMPVNFKTLQSIVTCFRLKNVRSYQWALGSKEGEIDMVMPVAGSVRLQGISHVIEGEESGKGDRARVLCKRLDDINAFFLPQSTVTAIKIDVEGYEYHVLEGSRRLISLHRPIIYCELTENENYGRSLDLINELEYDIKVLQCKQLEEFNPQVHRSEGNFFFIPKRRHVPSSDGTI